MAHVGHHVALASELAELRKLEEQARRGPAAALHEDNERQAGLLWREVGRPGIDDGEVLGGVTAVGDALLDLVEAGEVVVTGKMLHLDHDVLLFGWEGCGGREAPRHDASSASTFPA
jgi:hypothetical protein